MRKLLIAAAAVAIITFVAALRLSS